MSEPYLHASEVLFEPGDKVHPISVLEGKRSPYDGPNDHYSRDHVYVFRASEVPKKFRQQGRALYEVEPTGDVEADPEPFRGKPIAGSYRSRDPFVVKRLVHNHWRDDGPPPGLRGSNWEPNEQPTAQHIGLLTQHFAGQYGERRGRGVYMFRGVGAPEGEHAYFRGIHLGREDTFRRVMRGPNTLEYDDHPVHHSTDPDEVLGRLQSYTDRKREKGLSSGADHPEVRPFGSHWTTQPNLAHQFAFDPSHGRYRTPRLDEGAPQLGAVIEVHSKTPPGKGQSQYESEVQGPKRGDITRAFLHVHRYDPDLTGFYRQDTLVGTHEIPVSHLKQASTADRYTSCDQGHRHWGSEGAAGVLLRHTDEQGARHYLLQHRAPWVQEGDTWSIPGGALHPGEDPETGARREAREEMGSIPETTHAFTHTDDHGGWAYHTVVLDSPTKFGVHDHNHEVGAEGTRWVPEHEVDRLPLHSGFAKTWPEIKGRKATAMASGSQEHNRAFGYNHPKPTYVRFGDWPKDERSMNHIMGWKEDGVSVYDLDKHGDPMDPDYDMNRGHHHEDHCEEDCDLDEYNHEFEDDTAGMLDDHISDARQGHNVQPRRRAHLVQGEHVSFGHDDEPVLRNVKTVGHWPCDVHKFVPGVEPRRPRWCEHPDHDEEDE